VEEPDEDEGVRPLSDRLLTELSAHRTLALREAVASDPDVAFLAALHALTLKLFYPYPLDSCVDIEPKRLAFGAQAPGLADTASARAIEERHARWAAQLPKEPGELWDIVCALDGDSRQALFAHCVSLSVRG
jgi:ParB family chromosome partitioning protein